MRPRPVSSDLQLPTSNAYRWSYLHTGILASSSPFVFSILRTLSFSVDERMKPNPFTINCFRTLSQNMGGGGSRGSYKNPFQKSFKLLWLAVRASDEGTSPEEASRPKDPSSPNVTLLECALPRIHGLMFFRMRSYNKTGGRECAEAILPHVFF